MIYNRLNEFKNETNATLIKMIHIISKISKNGQLQEVNINENLQIKTRSQLQSKFIELISLSCDMKREKIEYKKLNGLEIHKLSSTLDKIRNNLNQTLKISSHLSWLKNNKRASLFLISLLRLSITSGESNVDRLYKKNIKNKIKTDKSSYESHSASSNYFGDYKNLKIEINVIGDELLQTILYIDENSLNLDKELINILTEYQAISDEHEKWIIDFVLYSQHVFNNIKVKITNNWDIVSCNIDSLNLWTYNNLKSKYNLHYFSEPDDNTKIKDAILNHLDIIYFFDQSNNNNDIKNIKNLFSRKKKDYDYSNLVNSSTFYSIQLEKKYWDKLAKLTNGSSVESTIKKLIDNATAAQDTRNTHPPKS